MSWDPELLEVYISVSSETADDTWEASETTKGTQWKSLSGLAEFSVLVWQQTSSWDSEEGTQFSSSLQY